MADFGNIAKHNPTTGSIPAAPTNLGNTPTASDVTITSSTGSPTTLAGATTSAAGVMTAAQVTELTTATSTNTTQDTAISTAQADILAIQAVNTSQNVDILAIESDIVAIETVNATQDADILALQASAHPAATVTGGNPALTINPTTQVANLDLTTAGSYTPAVGSTLPTDIQGAITALDTRTPKIVDNGLTLDPTNGHLELGGTLHKTTEIVTAGFDLNFNTASATDTSIKDTGDIVVGEDLYVPNMDISTATTLENVAFDNTLGKVVRDNSVKTTLVTIPVVERLIPGTAVITNTADMVNWTYTNTSGRPQKIRFTQRSEIQRFGATGVQQNFYSDGIKFTSFGGLNPIQGRDNVTTNFSSNAIAGQEYRARTCDVIEVSGILANGATTNIVTTAFGQHTSGLDYTNPANHTTFFTNAYAEITTL